MKQNKHAFGWKKPLFLLALAAPGLALTACSNGSSGSTPLTQYFAPLRGTQERPTQVATMATGALTVTFKDANTVNLQIKTSNLAGVTGAEVRVGKPGTNGPVIFPLYTASGTSTFPSFFNQNLTAANFTPQSSAGVSTLTDAVNAINAGNAYVNISTQQNPNGELRGQIGPAQVQVTLLGSSVVLPITTTAQASATVQLNAKQSVLTVVVNNTQNLQKTTHIGIYSGQLGANGPQLFTVFDSGNDGAFTGSVTRTLTATDLQKQTGVGISTYEDAVNAFLSGNTYILISTTEHTGGELRAQLTAQQQ